VVYYRYILRHDINWKFEVMPNFFMISNVRIFTTGKVIFGWKYIRDGINLRDTLTYTHSFGWHSRGNRRRFVGKQCVCIKRFHWSMRNIKPMFGFWILAVVDIIVYFTFHNNDNILSFFFQSVIKRLLCKRCNTYTSRFYMYFISILHLRLITF
jgi:hypothetical protein